MAVRLQGISRSGGHNAKIDNATITSAKIGTAQITSAHIQNAAIANAHIGNLEVDYRQDRQPDRGHRQDCQRCRDGQLAYSSLTPDQQCRCGEVFVTSISFPE